MLTFSRRLFHDIGAAIGGISRSFVQGFVAQHEPQVNQLANNIDNRLNERNRQRVKTLDKIKLK
jgi:hypothetical protein